MIEKNRDKINACKVWVDKTESTSAPGKVEIFCRERHWMSCQSHTSWQKRFNECKELSSKYFQLYGKWLEPIKNNQYRRICLFLKDEMKIHCNSRFWNKFFLISFCCCKITPRFRTCYSSIEVSIYATLTYFLLFFLMQEALISVMNTFSGQRLVVQTQKQCMKSVQS